MVHLTVTRRIAADPTSVALLMAGQSALRFCPGLRRVGDVDGLLRIEARLSSTTAAALMRARPPQREAPAVGPAAYRTGFDVTGSFASRDVMPELHGTLALSPVDVDPGHVETEARLDIDVLSGTDADIRALAEAFMDGLASAAEARSYAA